MPNQNVPNLKKLPENDSIDFDDSLIGFHMQAGLVDKSWYCSTVELARIVVLNGSRRITRRCR